MGSLTVSNRQLLGTSTIRGKSVNVYSGNIEGDDNSQPNVFTYFDGNEHTVYVNNRFVAQPVWYRNVLIMHEFGHIFKGHIRGGIDWRQAEYEADEYAYRNGYDVIRALRFDEEQFGRFQPKRITNIRRLMRDCQ
jgi:hypothetical protein